jgi:hypothetical protein
MVQMSYCSLEEAWGTEYANLYKKNDSMLTKMPEKDNDIDETILKDRNLTKISEPIDKNNAPYENYYINAKEKMENKNCDKFLEHFLQCNECKKKIDNILNINQKKTFVESFKNIDDNYLDIFVLILTGIFIIFVLDCFVRLGKNFK